jgi:hypothetical protein
MCRDAGRWGRFKSGQPEGVVCPIAEVRPFSLLHARRKGRASSAQLCNQAKWHYVDNCTPSQREGAVMKCRFGRGLLVALLLMILFFYPMLAPPVHRIDSDHYALIRNGMSLDEVELILGVPAGHYDWAVPTPRPVLLGGLLFTNDLVTSTSFALTIDERPVSETMLGRAADFGTDGMLHLVIIDSSVGRELSWISRHGTGTVWFDEHWRVVGKSGWGETSREPPWHNWRNWFKK